MIFLINAGVWKKDKSSTSIDYISKEEIYECFNPFLKIVECIKTAIFQSTNVKSFLPFEHTGLHNNHFERLFSLNSRAIFEL